MHEHREVQYKSQVLLIRFAVNSQYNLQETAPLVPLISYMMHYLASIVPVTGIGASTPCLVLCTESLYEARFNLQAYQVGS